MANGSMINRTSRERRKGLAPVELVLWLPVMLMVMALIVNYANMTSWRLRGEMVARDAIWRARWPRSGQAEPRIPTSVWPAHANVDVRGDVGFAQLNHPHINHPVARGPVLELGQPSRRFLVQPLLDQQAGARRGVSSIERSYDLLPALGDYRSGLIADRMLTRQWQCAQMGFPNRYRRTMVLYEMPRTSPSLPAAYVRSILGLLSIPHYSALTVLDRDEDWRIYYGHYPHFYPRISPDYDSTDPVEVYERSVLPLVDHLNERGEVEFGRISELPRDMTMAYLRMYERVKQEIEDLQEELVASPPPSAERRLWIISRLNELRQIQDLEEKISQLERDVTTLDARESQMRSFLEGFLRDGLSTDPDSAEPIAD